MKKYSDREIEKNLDKVFGEYCLEKGISLEDVFDIEWLKAWVRHGMPDPSKEGHVKSAVLLGPWMDQLKAIF